MGEAIKGLFEERIESGECKVMKEEMDEGGDRGGRRWMREMDEGGDG